MSGKPHVDGIQSLRLTLDRLAVIDAAASVLRAEIQDRQSQLTALQSEHAELAGRIPDMLQSMDIASNGNFGWQARLVWALRELASQYREIALAK